LYDIHRPLFVHSFFILHLSQGASFLDGLICKRLVQSSLAAPVAAAGCESPILISISVLPQAALKKTTSLRKVLFYFDPHTSLDRNPLRIFLKMPSMRRMRVFGILILLFVITVLWHTGSARQQRSPDFYRSTKTALENDRSYKTHQVDDDAALAAEMADRLRSADAVAKDNANGKAPSPRPLAAEKKDKAKAVVEDIASDINIAGRMKYPIKAEKEKVVQKTPEDHDVEVEINSILKRSPSAWEALESLDRSLTIGSHYLLEVILPSLQTRQGNPTQQIRYLPSTVRGGA